MLIVRISFISAIQVVSMAKNQTKGISFNVNVTDETPLLQVDFSPADSSSVLDSIEVQPATLRAMAESMTYSFLIE